MTLCSISSGLDFNDSCIRNSWSALLPTLFVVVVCTKSLLPKRLNPYFRDFLYLHEAEALDASGDQVSAGESIEIEVENVVRLWRTVVFSFIGMLQTMMWLAIGCFTLVASPNSIWEGISSILRALTWVYATWRPIVHPQATPAYDLFVLYTIHLVMGVLLLGGAAFSKDVYGTPLPPIALLVGLVFNIIATLVLLVVIVRMPMALLSNRVKKSDVVSQCSITSSSVLTCMSGCRCLTRRLYLPLELDLIRMGYPHSTEGMFQDMHSHALLNRSQGTHETLNEDDIWNLSPRFQSKPLFIKFIGARYALSSLLTPPLNYTQTQFTHRLAVGRELLRLTNKLCFDIQQYHT